MDANEIRRKMHTMSWYHKIELAPGVVTPGKDWEVIWEPMRRYHQDVDFRGKRVLEVGCWDGYWSFEAEKLGAAEIWATDDVSQRQTRTRTVPFVVKCLGSRVKYRDDVSVYDVDEFFSDQFDVVICYGILYHLRYPALAIAKLRRVLAIGGLLLLETAAVTDTDISVMNWGHKSVYPTDRSTWNAVSLSCLRFLLETSYFDVELCEIYLRQDRALKIGRAYAVARAVEGSRDHHLVPDRFLRNFDPRFRQ